MNYGFPWLALFYAEKQTSKYWDDNCASNPSQALQIISLLDFGNGYGELDIKWLSEKTP